jgi:hypothetical protein
MTLHWSLFYLITLDNISMTFSEANNTKLKFLIYFTDKFKYLRVLIPFTSVRVLKSGRFPNTDSLAAIPVRGVVYLILLQLFYPLQKVPTSGKRRSRLSDRWESTMQKQIQFPNPRCHFGRQTERERDDRLYEKVRCSRRDCLDKSE